MRLRLVGAAVLIALGGCAPSANEVSPALTSMPSTSTTTTTIPAMTAVGWSGETATIGADAAAGMSSWHDGCPVPISELRMLTVAFIGFDGQAHSGRLVVHRDVAADVLRVLHELFDAGFPIERMEPIDAYDGDDDRSMAANNTSGFNCRPVAGSSRWSEHAYGRAIDINPVQNPYISNGTVDPTAGAEFVDRSNTAAGVITADGPVVSAFARIGWGWGGAWRSAKDYQHFSASGR